MTTRKLQRRRHAIRTLLQNLDTRPFSEDALPYSGGWLTYPRPRLSRNSVAAAASQSERR